MFLVGQRKPGCPYNLKLLQVPQTSWLINGENIAYNIRQIKNDLIIRRVMEFRQSSIKQLVFS